MGEYITELFTHVPAYSKGHLGTQNDTHIIIIRNLSETCTEIPMSKRSTFESFIIVKFSEKYKLSSIDDETTISITTEKKTWWCLTKLQVHICMSMHFTFFHLGGGAFQGTHTNQSITYRSWFCFWALKLRFQDLELASSTLIMSLAWCAWFLTYYLTVRIDSTHTFAKLLKKPITPSISIGPTKGTRGTGLMAELVNTTKPNNLS